MKKEWRINAAALCYSVIGRFFFPASAVRSQTECIEALAWLKKQSFVDTNRIAVESAKGPVEVLVIDRVERPSEN